MRYLPFMLHLFITLQILYSYISAIIILLFWYFSFASEISISMYNRKIVGCLLNVSRDLIQTWSLSLLCLGWAICLWRVLGVLQCCCGLMPVSLHVRGRPGWLSLWQNRRNLRSEVPSGSFLLKWSLVPYSYRVFLQKGRTWRPSQ